VVARELAALLAMVAIAFVDAGVDWVAPFAVALPLFAIELWFDSRSRSRRLLPELCGAVGICAIAASIALAGGESATLAVALWMVLAARAVASVPFARTQVLRLRTTPPSPRTSDVAQLAGVVLAAIAVAIDDAVLLGAVAVVLVTLVQFVWSRGPARPAKAVGFAQLGFGLAVVFATATGVAS
jgi:hypothetical protein